MKFEHDIIDGGQIIPTIARKPAPIPYWIGADTHFYILISSFKILQTHYRFNFTRNESCLVPPTDRRYNLQVIHLIIEFDQR